jgi:NodT family efflux transporter outer membrane factor (OMF) lipoprotein
MLRIFAPNRRILAAIAAMSLVMSGCTSFRDYVHNGFKVGPNYSPPPGPVAGQWIESSKHPLLDQSEDLSRWWCVFADPTLNQLIAHSYRQNLTVKEAGYRIKEAQAQLGIARGDLFPQTQDITGSYTHSQSSHAGIPLLGTPVSDRWSVSANLAWQLDFWGQFRRAIEAAGANLDASVAGYDEAVITLLAAVASDYVEIRTDQRRIAVLEENVKLEKEILRVVRNRFNNGRASELDFEQAATTMESVAAQIPPVREDLRQTNARLCVLLGIPPEDLVRCMGEAPIPTAPPGVAIGIPCQLLTRRPDVRQAERLAAQQSAEIGVAIAAAYPMVTISGNFGWQSNELRTLFTPAGFNGSIGPSFQWNILNYGRILNNDRLQQATFNALVATYQATVLQAQADVETGLAAFLESQEQTKILQRSVTDAQKAVDVAWNQYQAGRTDMTTVATVALTLVQQQSLLAIAQGNIALGLITTYLGLGGGWEIRCQPQDNGPLGPLVPPPATVKPATELPENEVIPKETVPTPSPAADDSADSD